MGLPKYSRSGPGASAGRKITCRAAAVVRAAVRFSGGLRWSVTTSRSRWAITSGNAITSGLSGWLGWRRSSPVAMTCAGSSGLATSSRYGRANSASATSSVSDSHGANSPFSPSLMNQAEPGPSEAGTGWRGSTNAGRVR